MSFITTLIGTIAFAILAPIVGCLLAGLDRIISARMQGRVGPPILQPYYDVRKLIAKDNVTVSGVDGVYMSAALVFTAFAGGIFFSGGNLLMSAFIITMAGLFFIMAAYSSRSPYAELGAGRETVQVMSYEPMVLLMAVCFYMAAGTFNVSSVFMHGTLTARDGKYLPTMVKEDISPVKSSVHLKDFSAEKFKMHLKSDLVHTIRILPGGVVTQKSIDRIHVESGEFVFDPEADICKVAVVERHQMTGNVACGFLKGYGIKRGAIAVSIAHDSHNIIVVGVSDDEMACAVEALKEQEGGMVLVCGGKVVGSMPMPIAGLMSDQSGEWVRDRLTQLHETAWNQLGVAKDVEPIMTLTFMSLSVIPEVKLTDRGLFDYFKFSFIPVEANPGEMDQANGHD